MRILIAVTLCTLLAGLAVAGPASDGRALLKKGEIDKAIELLEKAAKVDEESLEIVLALGDAYLAAERADDAVTAASDAVDIDIDSAPGWLLWAKAYALKAEQIKAANGAGRDIRLCFADANKGAGMALKLDPKIAGAHIVKAQAAIGEFDTELAMKELRLEMEVCPKGAEAPQLLGNLLFDKKDFDGAIAAYKKSLENDPDNALAWKWLGMSHEWAKNRPAAAQAYYEAVRRNHTDAYAMERLLKTSITKEGNSTAIELFTKLVEELGGVKKVQAASAARKLAWLHGENGDDAEALAILDALIRTNPSDSNNHVYRAEALLKKSDDKSAIESLKKAILIDKEAKWPYDRLHQVALRTARSNPPATIAHLEWLFGIRANADVANNLGFTHRDGTRNFKQSLRWYLKASELAPRNVDILNDTGLIYQYHFNEFGKAMKFYEDALKIGRSDHAAKIAAKNPPRGYGDALENMAIICASRKQYKRANELLDELLGYNRMRGRQPATRLKNQIADK
jgi:tetratricopeptide (TPR) repeat protein